MLRGPTKHLFRPRCSSSFGTTLETDEQLLVAAARGTQLLTPCAAAAVAARAERKRLLAVAEALLRAYAGLLG